MTPEDEEFNRIEREAKQRMEAVNAALNKKAENARELGLDYEPVQDNSNYRLDPPGLDPLYTSPPAQRTWVGLTDEEIDEWTPEIHTVIRAIEAKLKEKNT